MVVYKVKWFGGFGARVSEIHCIASTGRLAHLGGVPPRYPRGIDATESAPHARPRSNRARLTMCIRGAWNSNAVLERHLT